MESAALSAIMAFISESIPVRLSPQELRHAMRSSGLHSPSSTVSFMRKIFDLAPLIGNRDYNWKYNVGLGVCSCESKSL